MDTTSHQDLFKTYYSCNKGTLFRHFEIAIGDFHYRYDIYWGDPSVIFDLVALEKKFPLAVTTIPQIAHYPDTRIYLHERLERKHVRVFELVIAHEIGHLWLHDIVGVNNRLTDSRMSESEAEVWADYFSYCYFVKYRNLSCPDDFALILKEASNLQMALYDLDPVSHVEVTFTKKMESLRAKISGVALASREGDPVAIHMGNAIDTTLDALGDIFA
jgi:hypothetical protein